MYVTWWFLTSNSDESRMFRIYQRHFAIETSTSMDVEHLHFSSPPPKKTAQGEPVRLLLGFSPHVKLMVCCPSKDVDAVPTVEVEPWPPLPPTEEEAVVWPPLPPGSPPKGPKSEGREVSALETWIGGSVDWWIGG